MSYYGRNNIGTGCGAIIVFICIGIITIILIVKGLSAVGGSNVLTVNILKHVSLKKHIVEKVE